MSWHCPHNVKRNLACQFDIAHKGLEYKYRSSWSLASDVKFRVAISWPQLRYIQSSTCELSNAKTERHYINARAQSSNSLVMALKCFCGSKFASINDLYRHATSKGHRLRCGCGKLCGTDSQLKKHQAEARHPGWDLNYRAVRLQPLQGVPGVDGGFPAFSAPSKPAFKKSPPGFTYSCKLCGRKAFKDDEAIGQDMAAKHASSKHPSCPSCNKVFLDKFGKGARSAQEGLLRHQQGTSHCYCGRHDIAFESEADFQAHKRALHTATDQGRVSTESFETQHKSGEDWVTRLNQLSLDEKSGERQLAESHHNLEKQATSPSSEVESGHSLDEIDSESDTSDAGGVSLVWDEFRPHY